MALIWKMPSLPILGGGLVALLLALMLIPTASAQGGDVEFVAVGASGTIRVSEDGDTWTTASSGVTNTLYGVAQGDGTWVVVGTSGRILTSDDGRSWNSQTTPTTQYLRGVAYSNGQWVVVGNSGTVLTSSDTAQWDLQTTPTSSSLRAVAHDGQGLWTAVGTGSTVITSPDAKTWTRQTAPSGSTYLSVAHDQQGLWMAGTTAGYSLSQVILSTDGTTWTQNTNYPHNWEVEGVAYSCGLREWKGVGYYGIGSSPDGSSWTNEGVPHGPFAPWYRAVTHHEDLGRWVIVGSGGRVAFSDGGTWSTTSLGSTTTFYGVAATSEEMVPAADLSVVHADDPELVADGVSTTSVHLQVRNIHGNRYCWGGDTVTFSTDLGTLGGVKDNNNGTYTIPLTSDTKAGLATIEATFNGMRVPNTAQVEFRPGPADLNRSTFDVDPVQVVANGSVSTATLRLYDQFDNPLDEGGYPVRVFRDLGDLTGTVDHQDGSYSAELSSLVAGVANVWVEVDDERVPIERQVEFLPGPMEPSASTLTVDPPILEADGSEATATLVLRDPHGNRVGPQGADVAFFLEGVGAVGPAQDQGDGTFTAAVSSTTKGLATVSAEIDGVGAGNDVQVEFRHAMPDPGMTRWSAPAKWPADGSQATVVLELYDAQGNRVEEGGYHVTMATERGAITKPVDQGDGTFTALLSSGRVGWTTLSAELQKQPVQETVDVQFVAGAADADGSRLQASPTAIPADGAATSTITLRLVDAQGNPVQEGGHDVGFATTLGTLSDQEDHGDGSYTIVLTAGTELGTARVTAALGGTELPDPVEVAFTTGAPVAERSTLDADPSRILADGGQAAGLTLVLRDASDHPIVGEDVVFTTDLGRVGPVQDHGDGSYTALLRGFDPGTATVGAFGLEAQVVFDVPEGPMMALLLPDGVVCVDEPFAIGGVAHHGGVEVASWSFDLEGTTLELGPDGQMLHRIEVEHSFGSVGTHEVSLTAGFANGVQRSALAGLEVRDCGAPEPDFIYSVEGMSVRFTDKSLDPDGMVNGRQWEFGDGGTSTEASPLHAYAELGQFLVRLTLVDAKGAEHTAEMVLVLTAPDAAGGEASQGDAGGLEDDAEDEVSQDAGVSQDKPGDDGAGMDGAGDLDATGDGDSGVSEEDLLYADFEVRTASGPRAYVFTADVPDWTETVVWEFSDGGTQIGRQVEHRFAEDRAYTVRLVATGEGQTAESVQMVSAMSSAPVGQVVEAQPVHGSGDPDPGARPAGEASLDGRSLTVLMGIALGVLLASVLVLALLMLRTRRRD